MIPLVSSKARQDLAGLRPAVKFVLGGTTESLSLVTEACPARFAARASFDDRYPNPTSGRATAVGAPFLGRRKARPVDTSNGRAVAGFASLHAARLAPCGSSMLTDPERNKNAGYTCLYDPYFLLRVQRPRSQDATCQAMRSAQRSVPRQAPSGRRSSTVTCLPVQPLARPRVRFAMTQGCADRLSAAHQVLEFELATGTMRPGGLCFAARALAGAGRD